MRSILLRISTSKGKHLPKPVAEYPYISYFELSDDIIFEF